MAWKCLSDLGLHVFSNEVTPLKHSGTKRFNVNEAMYFADILFTLKVRVNFTLEQAMKAQKGSRGIAILIL